MRRFVVFTSLMLICSMCAVATELSTLPPEAQASIKAALLRDSAIPDLTINDYTLTASDGVNYAGFGTSVAIDGNTVVVGATQYATFGKGAVYVFVKPSSGWRNMTQTAELTASDGQIGDALGCSVAISGSTIVAGACNATINGNVAAGAAYVFVEPANGWINATQTAKLTASDGVNNAYFGTAVSIGANTVAVGAPQYSAANPGPGSAYVFVKPSQGWSNMTQTAEFIASNGAPYDYFGWSVSMSSNTVIVGGGQCSSCAGTAYVFAEPESGWMNATETAQLTPSNGDGQEEFGLAVSISGNTVAVGNPLNGFETGARYTFS